MNKLKVVAEPGKQDIVVARVFDAPRELLWKVMHDPAYIPRWWGPRANKTVVDKMDVKPGGMWRYLHTTSGGNEIAFKGVYHAVEAPVSTIYTYELEGLPEPGHVGMVYATLEIQGNKTLYSERSLFPSVEDRDAVIESGMEGGAVETFDRLEELLQAEPA